MAAMQHYATTLPARDLDPRVRAQGQVGHCQRKRNRVSMAAVSGSVQVSPVFCDFVNGRESIGQPKWLLSRVRTINTGARDRERK